MRQGNLLLVPVGESLLYVRPLYTQAAGPTAVPELKKVIVTFNGNSYMRDTLGEALQAAFGQAPPVQNPPPNQGSAGGQTPPNSDQSVTSLLSQADAKFNEADAALKAGDLSGYQEAINEARTLVQQAGAAVGLGSSTTTAPDSSSGSSSSSTDIGQRVDHHRRLCVAGPDQGPRLRIGVTHLGEVDHTHLDLGERDRRHVCRCERRELRWRKVGVRLVCVPVPVAVPVPWQRRSRPGPAAPRRPPSPAPLGGRSKGERGRGRGERSARAGRPSRLDSVRSTS